MEFFDDIFAGWSFEIGNEINKTDFIEILTILDSSSILKLSSISVDFMDEPFHSINQTADLCVECFEKGKVLVLSGKTMLQIEGDDKMVSEAIVFTLEPPYQEQLGLISIDTHTDAWMPIGCLDEVLQIDSGVINSKRLKDALEQISRLRYIKKVDPAEEEYFHDYMAHQIGFGLFYKRSIENIKGLLKSDYAKVAPFILSS